MLFSYFILNACQLDEAETFITVLQFLFVDCHFYMTYLYRNTDNFLFQEFSIFYRRCREDLFFPISFFQRYKPRVITRSCHALCAVEGGRSITSATRFVMKTHKPRSAVSRSLEQEEPFNSISVENLVHYIHMYEKTKYELTMMRASLRLLAKGLELHV